MLLSDKEYIAAVHDGDERIFTHLVRSHIAALTRFAFGFTKVEEDAHDAVQEVFARIWELGHNWKPKATVAGYLYSAVRNRMLNTIRSQNSRQRMREAWGTEVLNSHELMDEDDIHSVSANIERSFNSLTDRQREAVRLRYDHQLSVCQVAEVLGINERATERLIARALRILRASLQGEIENGHTT